MNQLSNFISQYLKTCETIKKLDSKTLKAYRIDLSQFHTFMLSQMNNPVSVSLLSGDLNGIYITG